MKVWGVTESDIRTAAEGSGVAIYANDIRQDGRALKFRLALTDDRFGDSKSPKRWQRKSVLVMQGEKPRRIGAVCWHGHYAFMRFLLAIRPDARIKTSWQDYRGLASFLYEAPETGWRNIGNTFYPCLAENACYCKEYQSDSITRLDDAAEIYAERFGIRHLSSPYGTAHTDRTGRTVVTAQWAELYSWANRAGSSWPCSTLSQQENIRVVLSANGDLVDIQANPRAEHTEIPGDELSAWLDDVIHKSAAHDATMTKLAPILNASHDPQARLL